MVRAMKGGGGDWSNVWVLIKAAVCYFKRCSGSDDVDNSHGERENNADGSINDYSRGWLMTLQRLGEAIFRYNAS